MKGERTKKMLVDTIITLSKDTPVVKINVADIADAAGVSRQTFYYHFDSVFDAYAWMIRQNMKFPHPQFEGPEAPTPKEYVIDACRGLSANRELALAIFNGGFREKMFEGFRADLVKLCAKFIRENSKVDVPDKIILILARFHAEGNIGVVNQWMENGMTENIEETIPELYRMLKDAVLPAIIRNAEVDTED